MTDSIRRYAVAFTAIVVGIGMSIAYIALLNDAEHRNRNVPWDCCILLFTGAYNTGLVIYTLIGNVNEYQTLKNQSAWHTGLLSAAGAAFIGWDVPQLANLNNLSWGRILFMAWGAILLLIAAYQLFRAVSSRMGGAFMIGAVGIAEPAAGPASSRTSPPPAR